MIAAKLAKVSQLNFLILSLQTSSLECFIFSIWVFWFLMEIMTFFFPKTFKQKNVAKPNFKMMKGELERV